MKLLDFLFSFDAGFGLSFCQGDENLLGSTVKSFVLRERENKFSSRLISL